MEPRPARILPVPGDTPRELDIYLRTAEGRTAGSSAVRTTQKAGLSPERANTHGASIFSTSLNETHIGCLGPMSDQREDVIQESNEATGFDQVQKFPEA
jgi:DNA-binding CsgD family transcriptional regulator